MKDKDSLILYRTQCKSLLKFSPEQRGELFRQIVLFAFEDEEPTSFSDLASEVMFEQIADQIKRDQAKYREKCAMNSRIAQEREAAKKRAREATSEDKRARSCTNSTDTDNDTETDYESEVGNVCGKGGTMREGTSTHTLTREQVEAYYQAACQKRGVSARSGLVNRFMLCKHGRNWKAEIDSWIDEDIQKGAYDVKRDTGRFLNCTPSGTNWDSVADLIMERQQSELDFE